MGKTLIISPEKCTGCRTCEVACSFRKTDSFNPQNSAVTVYQYDEAAISIPVMCMQCEDPKCMKVCTTGAIYKDENDTVLIDRKKCIGCKLCIIACHFGNISYNYEQKTLVKCDLCGGDPQCAKLCPSGTIQFKEATSAQLSKKKALAEKFKSLLEEVEK
ncbi:4Fe-4S dicluster domain-containing protein [Fonticella tunisiensis]|uniref:4Fe-4S dicluster domain-containing protein n=1 Tax=Fonticella tunisiensis TaxID=1096341 RepID=UPI00106048F7|nr:4Fe-4S dicluster domain-containing protein [Fonticella tunisiensis]